MIYLTKNISIGVVRFQSSEKKGNNMRRYANNSGHSGIIAFEITHNSIRVEFKNGWFYLYNNIKPGMAIVENMQRLAESGRGLNTYINTTVKDEFFSKSR